MRAVTVRADPLHRAFSDRHFLEARDLHQMLDLVEAALAVLVAVTLIAQACDAGNADGVAVARILPRGFLLGGALDVAFGNHVAAAVWTTVAAGFARRRRRGGLPCERDAPKQGECDDW